MKTTGRFPGRPARTTQPVFIPPFVVGRWHGSCDGRPRRFRGLTTLFMKKTFVSWMRTGVKLAYHPGKDPKKPLPGPFFDLSVVGLFLFLGIGYFFI